MQKDGEEGDDQGRVVVLECSESNIITRMVCLLSLAT